MLFTFILLAFQKFEFATPIFAEHFGCTVEEFNASGKIAIDNWFKSTKLTGYYRDFPPKAIELPSNAEIRRYLKQPKAIQLAIKSLTENE